MKNQTDSGNGRLWEERWQSGDTPWDHGAPAPPFAEFVEREGAPCGPVLIPGAGSGHDVRFFAERGAMVTGLDISPSAVEHARKLNPHPNAEYRLGDVLHPDPGLTGRYAWVIEHTCLCALPPRLRSAYGQAVPRFLAPGGQFLAIFYRTPAGPDGPPFGISDAEIDDLFDSAFTLIRAWVPTRAYPSRIGREQVRWYRKR